MSETFVSKNDIRTLLECKFSKIIQVDLQIHCQHTLLKIHLTFYQNLSYSLETMSFTFNRQYTCNARQILIIHLDKTKLEVHFLF